MPIKTRNLFKLVTREDSTHFHKLLGTTCLLNFIYQFYHLFMYNNMNLQTNKYTPFLLLFHGLLSMSSFIFHVPTNRHKGLPMIYKEFRLHSIVFALRSVACSLCFYYNLDLIYNILFINLTMILADIATIKYKAETKTMRGMPYGKDISEEDKRKVTYMHSSQQLGATMFMVGNIDSAFAPLLAIQLAAFLMTLVRKSIISEMDWHRVYAISLWLNIFVYWSFQTINLALYIIWGVYAFDYLRIKKGNNKYVVWNCVLLVVYICDNTTILNGLENLILPKYAVNSFILFYLVKNIYNTRVLWC
jgi:hypothetical protein